MSSQHGKRTIGLVAFRLRPITTNCTLGVVTGCNAGTVTANLPHPRFQVQLRSVHRGSSAQYDTCLASYLIQSLLYRITTSHSRRRLTLMNMSSTMSNVQRRNHSGHHHHHHHHLDNTYLVSKNKKDAAVRITRIGLYINLSMALGKGFGGYAFHSQGKRTILLSNSWAFFFFFLKELL